MQLPEYHLAIIYMLYYAAKKEYIDDSLNCDE